jgi:DNA-binding SARP family transcriptional activator
VVAGTAFRVLGPVRALVGGAPVDLGGNRERALLALLLLSPGQVVPTERLVEELWEGDPTQHAVANLRVHVSRLRKAVGDLLRTEGRGYLLVVPALDLRDVEHLATRARVRLSAGDPEGAAVLLREALALWQGRPFADVTGPPAVAAQAAALEERRLGLLEELVDAELVAGRHAAVAAELERLTASHPLRERFWEQRMLGLYRCGRQAEALAAYQSVRALLRDEHGLEPSPALRRLEQAILRQDPALEWAPRHRGGVPLPPALALPLSTPFLGRRRELELLADQWEQARTGHRRAVLVAGEPGIGKSRLLSEAARRFHEDGAVVLFGRCDEQTLVPYQPLVEALRHYAAHTSTAFLREALGRDAGELTRLLPDLREELGPSEGTGAERFRLFETINVLLGALSVRTPVVVVLEDLQWLDSASAHVLRHLFRHPLPGAVLVLASYRDNEISPGHPFADVLAELRLPHAGVRLRLDGLEHGEVAALLTATLGAAGDEAFAVSLQRQTDGNPFFVEEVARQLRDTHALAAGDLHWEQVGIPEGVRDVIGRRLLRLQPTTGKLLQHAAVLGRTFEAVVVEQVSDLTPDEVLEAVEEAVAAGLLRESASRPGRYAFTHDLVRQTLYSQLSLLRRARLHRSAGDVLERVGAEVPELAHHYLRGAQAGDSGKALGYSVEAGTQALQRLAYDEAAEWFQRALEVVDDDRSPLRADPLLGLGEALRRAGDTEGGRGAFLQASDLARALDDHDLLGRAALGYGQGSGGLHRAVRRDDTHIALLEEALGLLDPGDSRLRVRLMARLAEELYFTPQSGWRASLADEAVAMAERLGDPPTLLSACYVHDLIRVGPDVPPSDRAASTGRLVALARSLGERETAYLGHLLRELAHVELGDAESGLVELEGASQLADELQMPNLQAWVLGARSRRAWLAGDLVGADRLNAEATARATELGGDPDVASLVLGGQLLAHQILRSDLAAFVPPLEAFRDAYPHLPILRGFLAYAYAETGKLDLAQQELQQLGEFPRTVEWPGSVWSCGRAAALLGDVDRAGQLYAEALPLSGQWFADWASICLGPVDTVLGLLALTRGEVQAAVGHLEAAVEQAAAWPSPPWLADAQRHLATARAATGDDVRAAELRASSREIAERHGLGALLR